MPWAHGSHACNIILCCFLNASLKGDNNLTIDHLLLNISRTAGKIDLLHKNMSLGLNRDRAEQGLNVFYPAMPISIMLEWAAGDEGFPFWVPMGV